MAHKLRKMKFILIALFLVSMIGPGVHAKIRTHRVSSWLEPYHTRLEIGLNKVNVNQNERGTDSVKNQDLTRNSNKVVLPIGHFKFETSRVEKGEERIEHGKNSRSNETRNADRSTSKTFEMKHHKPSEQTSGSNLKNRGPLRQNKIHKSSLRRKILKAIAKANVTILSKSKGEFLELVEKIAWFYSQHPESLLPQPEMHCYKALCSVPKSTNKDLWQNISDSRLRLNVWLPRLKKKSKTRVEGARLHVFVKPRQDCQDCSIANRSKTKSPEMIIEVYRFRRPFTYKKRSRKVMYKRRLLDRLAVSSVGNFWAVLNVDSMVKMWMKRSKNFGLEISVTDPNGDFLNARDVLAVPDCLGGTRVRSCHGITANRTHPPISPDSFRDTNPYIDVVTKKIQKSPDIEAVAKQLLSTLKSRGLIQEERSKKNITSDLERKFKEIKRSKAALLVKLGIRERKAAMKTKQRFQFTFGGGLNRDRNVRDAANTSI